MTTVVNPRAFKTLHLEFIDYQNDRERPLGAETSG